MSFFDRLNNRSLLFLTFIISLILFTHHLDTFSFEFRNEEVVHLEKTRQLMRTGLLLDSPTTEPEAIHHPFLFHGLLMAFLNIFGNHWIGARLLAVLFGILTMCVAWQFTKDLFDDKKLATLTALTLMSGKLFFRHARAVVPDMLMNFFFMLSLYSAFQYFKNPEKKRYPIIFAASCAFGYMVNGLSSLCIPVIIAFMYACISKKTKLIKNLIFTPGLFALSIAVLLWTYFISDYYSQSFIKILLYNDLFQLSFLDPRQMESTATAFTNQHILADLARYFAHAAPWVVFIFVAVPLAINKIRQNNPRADELKFLLAWTLGVFIPIIFFFRFAYINILILAAPIAILVSYFLLEKFSGRTILEKITLIIRKYIFVIAFCIGFILYSFLCVFFIGFNKLWVLLFFLIFTSANIIILKTKSLFVPPLIFSVFLMMTVNQSNLVAQAGFNRHAKFKELSHTIQNDLDENKLIAVGSHKIKQTVIQSLFEQDVMRYTESYDKGVKKRIAELLSLHEHIFLFMTKSDFDRFVLDKDKKTWKSFRELWWLKEASPLMENSFWLY